MWCNIFIVVNNFYLCTIDSYFGRLEPNTATWISNAFSIRTVEFEPDRLLCVPNYISHFVTFIYILKQINITNNESRVQIVICKN
jgi:hypothetical protein